MGDRLHKLLDAQAVLDGLDNRSEVRQFLASRRAKITPQEAGLAASGGSRRVKGLRREEVALLAGVSVEYYARLERGSLGGVSESVLESVARALQLDAAERAHLLGRALYAPVFGNPANRGNLARFRFLDPRSAEFYPDWDESAATTVNLLHTEAGRDPYNRDLTALVGELSTRSQEFRTRWAAHDVRLHYTGTKRFDHPAVGELVLAYEAMPLPADPGLTLTVFSAEPGSAAHDGLKLLASWAVTLASAEVAQHPEGAGSRDAP